MSEVLVGSAYSTMELRYQQFAQGASVVEQQIQRLQALSKTPITVQAQIGSGAGSGAGALTPPAARGGGAAPQIDADAAAYTRLQRAQASLEAQQARLARQQGDTAKAAQLEAQAQERLTTELNAQNGITVQSIAIERQLASVQQQAVRGAEQEAAAAQKAAAQQRAQMDSLRGALTPATDETNKLAGAFGGLQSAVGTIGIGIGIAQLTSLGIEAGRSALSLRETQNSLRAIAGDTATYNQVIATARQQQIFFGGTLEENIKGLTGLTITARQSGASLKTLTDLSQRLGVLDPEQGAAGARVALSEALSGDPTSLARRYEIPRAALAKLRDTTIPVEERLKIIDSFLNKVGITSESVAGKVDKTAATYRMLGAAVDTAKTSLGGLIADGFAPLAGASANILQGLEGTTQGFGSLVVGANNLSRSLSGMPPLTASTEAGIRSYADAVLGFVGVQQRAVDGSAAQQTAIVTVGTAAQQQATLVQQSTAAQLGYANSLEMSGVQARALALANQQKADSDKLASVDAQTHALAEKQVDDSARAAADAMLANGRAGQIAAIQLATSSSLIDQRAAAYYRLEAATIAANNAENAKLVAKTVATNRFTDRSSGREGGSDFAAETAASVAATKTQTAQTERQIDAQIALASAQGNTAKQIDLLRQKEKLYGKDAVDRQNIEAQIIGLQKSAGKTRVDAAQSTALSLNQVEQNSGLQLLKTQRENAERLADQEQDFALKRSRSVEDYEEQRRKLLAHGQRAQAAQLTEDFAKDQRRAQEDFNLQRQRTQRNNAESTGDIDDRTDLRQSQIGDRAALRGGRPASSAPVDLGSAPPTLTGAGSRGAGAQGVTLVVQVQQLPIQLDGKTIATASWPELRELFDIELDETIAQLPPVGGGQSAVAGNRP